MQLNDPRMWGKSPLQLTVEVETLAQTAIATASKFIDENPFTALLCLMGTQGNFDPTLYHQAAERIKCLTARVES